MITNDLKIGDVVNRVFTTGNIEKVKVVDKNKRSVHVIKEDGEKLLIPRYSGQVFFFTIEECKTWLKKVLTERNVALIKEIEKNQKILLGL